MRSDCLSHIDFKVDYLTVPCLCMSINIYKLSNHNNCQCFDLIYTYYKLFFYINISKHNILLYIIMLLCWIII